MSLAPKAIVTMGDSEIKFVKLELHQCYFDHHKFILTIDHKIVDAKIFDKIEEKVGMLDEKVTITIQKGENEGKAYVFTGVITEVRMDAKEGVNGLTHLIGMSPTIELERGNMMNSFDDMNLEKIFETVTASTLNLNVSNKPRFKKNLEFLLQYNETDYHFLQKIAKEYGEELFFSGTDLIFGEHLAWDKIPLKYDINLIELYFGSRLIANPLVEYYVDRNNAKMEQSIYYEDENTFHGIASKKSNNLNIVKKQSISTHVMPPDMDSFQEIANAKKYTGVNKMVYVKGVTTSEIVPIGRIVDITLPESMEVNEDVGSYRVTDVIHSFDQNMRYRCEFEGIPVQFPYVPYPEMEQQYIRPLEALVIDNQDPLKIGRVKVQFYFEKRQCNMWMRVSTPDGGGNKHIGKSHSRGLVTTPEIGDNVIVSFLGGGAPQIPYISGSLFHASNAKNIGGGQGNHIRGIWDKANNYIRFNSAAGIVIMDQAGSTVTLDGKGNIIIKAPEKIGILAGENQGSGSYITLDKRGNIDIAGSKITINASKNVIPMDDLGSIPILNDDERTAVAYGYKPEPKSTYKDGEEASNGEVIIFANDTCNINSGYMLQAGSKNVDVNGIRQTELKGGGGKIIEEGGFVNIN